MPVINERNLAHYGVLGMKWGIRKKVSGGLRRAGSGIKRFGKALNSKIANADPEKVRRAGKITARILSAGLALHTLKEYGGPPYFTSKSDRKQASYDQQYKEWLRTAG